MAEFVHPALEDASTQIRLLYLLPGDSSSDIELQIRTRSLEVAPRFIAISYSWGDSACQQLVWIGDKRCFVRQNCYYALWQARLHHSNELVWIDSICINQHDLEEKGQQVQIMGEIYKAASLVLACVGPHKDGSDQLDACAQKLKPYYQEAMGYEENQNGRYAPWVVSEGKAGVMRTLEVFKAFSKRSYWNRLWIVQELLLARQVKILCGHSELERTLVRQLADIFVYRYGIEGLDWYLVPQRWHIPYASSGYLDVVLAERDKKIESVLVGFGSQQCADARDRFYGLIGLIDWDLYGMPAPKPDYTLSIFQVALHIARYVELSSVVCVLSTLQINAANEDLQRCIKRRQQQVPKVEEVLSSSQRRYQKPYNEHAHRRPEVAAVIETDQEGRLTAPFSGGAYNSDGTDYEVDSLGATPARLYVRSGIAALACEAARAGDLLVFYHEIRRDIGLVLRARHGDTFDIVGQAIIREKYQMCGGPYGGTPCYCLTDAGLQHTLLKVRVELDLSVEDSLILWNHDVSEITHFVDDKIDPGAHIERLRTRVTFSPYGAARVTVLERLNERRPPDLVASHSKPSKT